MAPLIEAAVGDRMQGAPPSGHRREPGKIKADAAQLEAAILSLVAHACRSMAAGGLASGELSSGGLVGGG